MSGPDGGMVVSFPLPADHWLTAPGENIPPMPMRTGTASPARIILEASIENAARFAVRAATMNGAVKDFDPDALVTNIVIGLIGYYTPDGTRNTSAVRARDESK